MVRRWTRSVAAALVVTLVVVSGCLGGTGAERPSTPDPVECEGPPGVAFWMFESAGSWDPDLIRVGYGTPGESDLLLVAYVDGEVLGVKNVSAGESIHVDGAPIQLDRRLSGEHEVRVAVHRDRDGDGQFDPGKDPACLDGDGERVQTGPETVHFSWLATPTPTDDPASVAASDDRAAVGDAGIPASAPSAANRIPRRHLGAGP